VVFPNGKRITAPRPALLSELAKRVGYSYDCSCDDGRCGKCWHEDPTTGELYMFPINCAGMRPSVWRAREEEAPGVVSEIESWMPLKLRKAPEKYEEFLKTPQEEEDDSWF